MKQKLLFIFALLCAVAQGAWSQNVVDLSNQSDDYVAKDGKGIYINKGNKVVIK